MAPAAARPFAPLAAEPSRAPARHRSAPAAKPRPARVLAASAQRQSARAPAPRRRPLLLRPQAAAERGLGTTVLGILGLVALPVALLGLALSGGGLVWAIVAGAAGLAVLVAYLDPFGH